MSTSDFRAHIEIQVLRMTVESEIGPIKTSEDLERSSTEVLKRWRELKKK